MPPFERRALLGVEVGGLQRWTGPVEFLGLLPGVELLAPSPCWAEVGVVGGFRRKQWLRANQVLGGVPGCGSTEAPLTSIFSSVEWVWYPHDRTE